MREILRDLERNFIVPGLVWAIGEREKLTPRVSLLGQIDREQLGMCFNSSLRLANLVLTSQRWPGCNAEAYVFCQRRKEAMFIERAEKGDHLRFWFNPISTKRLGFLAQRQGANLAAFDLMQRDRDWGTGFEKLLGHLSFWDDFLTTNQAWQESASRRFWS